jgi:hypothetical protein
MQKEPPFGLLVDSITEQRFHSIQKITSFHVCLKRLPSDNLAVDDLVRVEELDGLVSSLA